MCAFAVHHRRMADERAFDTHSDGQSHSRRLDRLIADLASAQHGVVARRQLLRHGLGAGAIDLRVGRGRLHVVHRGVYAVGHPLLSVDARWMAAVLAGGEGAVLSHRDAAALWGIRSSARALIEVTVTERSRSRPGLEVHRCRIPADERTAVRGIPVTTAPRTLFDLAAVVGRRQLERAVHEAEVLRLHDPLSLHDLLSRHPRSRGAAALRAILADAARGSTVSREELVDLFLSLLDRAGLPPPERGQLIEARGRSFEVDCVWREQALIVELDGHQVHSTRRGYEGDRARDRALAAAEWLVVRITWRQLQDEPDAVARDLRSTLARRTPRRPRTTTPQTATTRDRARIARPPFDRMLDPPWQRTPRSSSGSSR
jgi:predicted transcriptional regulator of viral defense system